MGRFWKRRREGFYRSSFLFFLSYVIVEDNKEVVRDAVGLLGGKGYWKSLWFYDCLSFDSLIPSLLWGGGGSYGVALLF
jgi:hypothetical protein